jgi:hypothetical protein
MRYDFTITIGAEGANAGEAWKNAIRFFSEAPVGLYPKYKAKTILAASGRVHVVAGESGAGKTQALLEATRVHALAGHEVVWWMGFYSLDQLLDRINATFPDRDEWLGQVSFKNMRGRQMADLLAGYKNPEGSRVHVFEDFLDQRSEDGLMMLRDVLKMYPGNAVLASINLSRGHNGSDLVQRKTREVSRLSHFCDEVFVVNKATAPVEVEAGCGNCGCTGPCVCE